MDSLYNTKDNPLQATKKPGVTYTRAESIMLGDGQHDYCWDANMEMVTIFTPSGKITIHHERILIVNRKD